MQQYQQKNRQNKIEALSMRFDETNVFQSVPSLIRQLISPEMITAKVYLRQKDGLSEQDLTLINLFGSYTLEAIMIHVLGC